MAKSQRITSEKGIVVSSYETARSRYPFPLNLIAWLFDYIISIPSFTIKVLIRSNMGRKSVRLDIIIFAFIWVRFFLMEKVIFSSSSGDNWVSRFFQWVSGMFRVLGELFFSVKYFELTSPENGSQAVLFFSYLIVVIGLVKLVYAIRKPLIYKKTSSSARGQSLLFGWVTNRFTWNITNTVIWFLDPILVFFIATLISIFDPGLGFCLQIGAVALLIEEYRSYVVRQEEVQEVIDGEFKAQRIIAAMERFDAKETAIGEKKTVGFGTSVSPGTNTDYNHIRRILKQKERFKTKSGIST